VKEKGTQLNKIHIKPNISLLNGDTQLCANYIPSYFLFYEPHETDKTNQKIKLWMKFEHVNIQEIKQINKNLKEISIWFTDKDVEKIKEFLQNSELKEQRHRPGKQKESQGQEETQTSLTLSYHQED